MNVLIIESNPTWQNLYAGVLGFLGCSVETAFDPSLVVKQGSYDMILCHLDFYADRCQFSWLDFQASDVPVFYTNRLSDASRLSVLVPKSRLLNGSAPLGELEKALTLVQAQNGTQTTTPAVKRRSMNPREQKALKLIESKKLKRKAVLVATVQKAAQAQTASACLPI
jgi:hypothetical protein